MKRWGYGGRYVHSDDTYTAKMMEHDTWQRTDYPTYHGTPLAPEQLHGHMILVSESSARVSGAPPASLGKRYVYTSRHPHPFPVIRSLFHHKQPVLQMDPPDFYLSRAINQKSALHIFVGATALQLLINTEAKGYIYGCDGRLSKPNCLREDIDEYRGPAMNWFTCGQVDAHDLPSDLLVVDDRGSDSAWNFIKAYKAARVSPDCVADQHGIKLWRCGEYLSQVREDI